MFRRYAGTAFKQALYRASVHSDPPLVDAFQQDRAEASANGALCEEGSREENTKKQSGVSNRERPNTYVSRCGNLFFDAC